MASFSTHSPWIFTFGLLGNFVSFVVFLAPIPTFLRICKKKTTEGFQSLPYVVALFSAMIWLYYASLKSDALLLITINSFGCFIETIYIALYIAYAPKQARTATLRMLMLLNFGGFCSILLLSHFFVKGSNRVQVLGWFCVILSVSVFAAPLSIMRLVIRTKSVEFMPFTLSFFLTLSAVMWLFYGVLLKDVYIAIPNVVGFILGVIQMALYVIYKNSKTVVPMEPKLPQHNIDIAKLSTASCEMKPVVCPHSNEEDDHSENSKDPSNQEQPRQCEV
ncbi:hypothetical protein OIU76_022406 [Salix suchowensis]|nr:bidirectional sugar transporter [Salix suchowensis]KAJ6294317.1 hypothetical protein OIU76_022406 [Salix suchowensis]KAJ6374561.1 hypothetical protein OIU78_030129 [Salix suchowensis]